MPEDDDLALLPPAAWECWRDCDLLFGIGSRLELQHFRWRWFPKGVKTIGIDINPTEFVRLQPDIGIVADAADGAGALCDCLTGKLDHRQDRSSELRGYLERAAHALASVQPQEGYLRVIRDILPRNGFFVEEVNQVGFTARMCLPVL